MKKQDQLISKINSLEKKIKTDKDELKEKKALLKKQLKPVVFPLLVIGGVGLGYLIVRKKRGTKLFGYLTSLSLAAASIYKNGKLVMDVIHAFDGYERIPGKKSREDE